MPVLRMLGARPENLSPEQRQEREFRISSIRHIADQVSKAKKLAMDRDSGKRKWADISPGDKQLLEDYDTGKLQKRRKEILAPRNSPFRSRLSPSASIKEEDSPLGD